MTKQERLDYIEQQTGMKAIDIEVEKFEKSIGVRVGLLQYTI